MFLSKAKSFLKHGWINILKANTICNTVYAISVF